jgi:hypothetical protein
MEFLKPYLNIFRDELELAECPLRVGFILKVGKRNFEHTALQTLGSDTYTGKKGC